MGGIKYPHLHDVAHKIWEWCNKKQIWIFAEYIASKENPADKESRITNIDTEWELAKFAFEAIILEFGIPEIDLFATKINKKCSKFCSWQRDPEALVINAFTLSWKKYFWYAFPPFSLIMKVLKKVKEDETTGIIIVPDWCSQPWYPIFLEMLIKPPLKFQPHNQLLLSPCRKQIHPLSSKLALIAGLISGRNIKKKT